jgi:DNA repair exonuclease SbcCD ATPase subunit
MTELDQKKLEAEITNLEAQTAKIDAERYSFTRSWRDWVLEATKLVGALVLGAGGITAAITGYQLSEVKKERTDFETAQAQAKLDELNLKKASTQEQLDSINRDLKVLQTSLEEARSAKAGKSGLLDAAISRAADIGNAVAKTNAQLRSDLSAPLSHKLSDYLVGLQTIGVDDAGRQQLNEHIRDQGYGLHDISASYDKTTRPPWFAPKSTVFYYANSALPAAKGLAGTMKQLTGDDFVVQRGSGLGVDPAQRDVTLFVHYIKN